LPPLRRPRDTSPERTQREDGSVTPRGGSSTPRIEVARDERDVVPIKPNFVRHAPERTEEPDDPAPPSLVPRLSQPEYYCHPSIEAMSQMSEVKLSRIDNLEIGRYGYGCVRWPGLTDVRGLDFDACIIFERGSVNMYPDREQPKMGEELNKEAVIELNVRPTRPGGKLKSPEVLKARLAKISEEFGGRFISYDMEKWIFRMPHFNGLQSMN